MYEHHKDYAYCSYDLDPDTGKAEEHRCKPENTTDIMTYSGSDPNACTITVANVTDEYDCQWAARLDEDLGNTVINITVAKEIQNITIEAEEMIAGQESAIKCNVMGGRPAPTMNFDLNFGIELVNSTVAQDPGE